MELTLPCACGKNINEKCITSLSLELVKVGGYVFPNHVIYSPPRGGRAFLFLKWHCVHLRFTRVPKAVLQIGELCAITTLLTISKAVDSQWPIFHTKLTEISLFKVIDSGRTDM